MRLLVCLLAGLGDAIMASPMIRAIKMQCPQARIETISALAAVRDYAVGNPDIESSEHEDFLDYSLAHKFVKLMRLRARNYDYTILPYPARRWQYHAGALVLGHGRLVAHNYRRLQRLMPGYSAQLGVEQHHQAQLNLSLLPALGLRVIPIDRYTYPAQWGLGSAGTPRREIAFHLSSGNSPISKGNERKSPSMHFYAHVMRIVSARGYAIAAIGSGQELASVPLLEKATGVSIRSISGNLREVAQDIRDLACVVAPDSGIGHLAAAIGTPVYSIFGITDPLTFAPLGDVRIYRPSSCSPCFHMSDERFTCKRHIDFACLNNDLSAEAAAADILQFIGKHTRRSQDDCASAGVINLL